MIPSKRRISQCRQDSFHWQVVSAPDLNSISIGSIFIRIVFDDYFGENVGELVHINDVVLGN